VVAATSIVYFFSTCILLGFIIDFFVKSWHGGIVEKLIIRLGVGLAVFSFLGVVFNVVGVPLDWRVFLGSGLVVMAGGIVRNKGLSGIMGSGRLSWDLRKVIHFLVILVLFSVTAKMYIGGTFRYSWFEDGDPWGYAVSSKYIAEKKTFSAGSRFNHYSIPYTQGYQIVMGVLHQTNNSIYWNMKFFNAFVISFGVVFFYFFVKRFTSDDELALAAAFFLFAVPAWVSHFVFSLGYNMTIFVVILYVFAMISREDELWGKGWTFVGIIVVASLCVNHFYTAFIGLFLLGIYYLNKSVLDRTCNGNMLAAIVFGLLLSLVFYIPAYYPYRDSLGGLGDLGGAESMIRWIHGAMNGKTLGFALFMAAVFFISYIFRSRWTPTLHRVLDKPAAIPLGYLIIFVFVMGILLIPEEIFTTFGTGTRDYGLSDFFVAKSKNMINNPVGIGLAVMGLFCLGIVACLVKSKETFKPGNAWLSTSLLWAVLSILIILGTYFSITVAPFRMWTFFGLFASLIAAYGFKLILRKIPDERMKIVVWALLAAIVIPTSFVQKYQVNNSIWPDHMVRVPESRALYERMRNGAVPRESKVLRLCRDSAFLVGYDMSLEPILDKRAKRYHKRALNDTVRQNWKFFKKHDIEYITAGLSCAVEKRLSGRALNQYVNVFQKRINDMIESGRFSMVEDTNTEVLLRVR